MKTNKTLKYSYFPGCVGQTSAYELDVATRAVAEKLGIELVKMEEATCCGAGHMQDANNEFATAINARHLAYAEKLGCDLLTICDTCQLHINEVSQTLNNNPAELAKANKALTAAGLEYKGTVKVKHLLLALIEDYGLENLKAKVVRPLKEFNIAPFYGCQILRPGAISGMVDVDNPTFFEDVIRALGGNPIDYDSRTKCCGFHVDLVANDATTFVSGRALDEAKAKKADFVVTPCPLCHLSLDAQQEHVEHKLHKDYDLPVLHLPQMIGLALGLSTTEVLLNKNIVRPNQLIQIMK